MKLYNLASAGFFIAKNLGGKMALSLLAANNAQTVLAAGISSTATSLTVNTGTGTLFPSPVTGTSFFKLTIIDAATGSLTEIVHVTARNGDVFTIQRGQEGTVARAWSANDIAANMMTAGTLSYILGNFQPLDPTLTALAALVGVANKLPYFNGNDTAALTDLTQVGRDIIGKSTIADILTYLGLSKVMDIGDFGLGVKNETKPGGMAALGVTQFDYFNPADNIGPLPGSWCGGLSYAMGDDIGFQLAGSGQLQPYENPRLFLRSKFADKTFTQWGEIYHTLNKPTASDLGITLGTAASRDVGTGTNQIPDMSSFTSGGNADARWRKLPDGTIEQFGIVNGMTTNAVTVAYPIAFPSELTSFEVAATGNLLANSYNSINIAATPAQGNNRTHFSATGYNTFTDGRTALNNVMFYWRAIGR
ncbi:hypothetical protein [Citrobacter freundii]|uniref:gp53-like domain-containing protein n=2 Tax=Citrobacter freundii TaxID=546 RepID=UPI0027A9C614|nr:hypothetical protein O9240_17575 [Citrobacter freundii]